MRSMILSVVLAVGAMGLALASPSQVRADEHRGPAFERGATAVAYHMRGYSHYRYRGFYPYGGYGGYGLYRGYYPYGGYGGYGLYGGYGGYYPRMYGGGYYPWGGYGAGPYSRFNVPGYFW